MKWRVCLLTVLLSVGLSACGNKEEPPVPETAPAAEEPVATPTPEAAKSSGGGGYEPTAEERVPGITMSQEEIDKQTAEALADTPKPQIPGEATAAE